MKVFISLPHNGRAESDIQESIDRYFEEIKSDKNIKNDSGTWELIDTVHNMNVPSNPSRLWYLGEAIKKLDQADIVYFAGDWYKAKGCWVEFIAANLYGKALTYNYNHPVIDMLIRDAVGAIRSVLQFNSQGGDNNDQ